MFKISNISRILLSLGALSLLIMLYVPIWLIYLTAPQYPEGLEMQIWHNTLTGDVQVVSALNHYIGMRAISVDMFPEFQYLGTVIKIVAGVCLALALIGRWWSSIMYWVILAIADSLALYDFWRWGYDYGHNLNPDAPIVIPGMAYQPPVLGYKKLLNFEAWSLPDTGGWVLMGVTGLSVFVVVYEWWKRRRQQRLAKPAAALVLLFSVFFWQCATGPQPLKYGTDNCDFCKMTLMDNRFGAELMTKKGKAYKFDDVNCFVQFQKKGMPAPADIAGWYVADYAHPGVLLDAKTAVYLRSDQLNTPMASGIAAFANAADLEAAKLQPGGETLNWAQLQAEF